MRFRPTKIDNLKYPQARTYLSLSLLECFFFSLMVASTESYITYFAVKAGTSPFQLAMITGGPLCLGALAQLFIPRFIKQHQLENSIVLSQLTQAFGILGLIYSSLVGLPFLPTLLSLLVYWGGGSVCGPLWLDWMQGVLPRKFYRYFLSQKGRLMCLTTLITYPLISFLMKNISAIKPWHLFAFGLVARLISMGIQIHMGNLGRHCAWPLLSPVNAQKGISNILFHPNYVQGHFKKFIIFFSALGLFKFSVTLSSPFFLPYMLNELHFSQLNFVLLSTIPLIGRILFSPFWARQSVGQETLKVMQLASVMIALIPILWIFSNNFLYLSLVELYAGIFWAAFELAIVLIIQQAVLSGPRTLIGEQMAFLNVFGLLGSMAGAQLLEMGISSHYLFFISGISRIVMAVVLIYVSTKIFLIPLKTSQSLRQFNFIPAGIRRMANIKKGRA